jgi:serine protease Do
LEWYDSGIGFAIPLAQIQSVLERMKAGEDLYPGILGVSLEPGNPFVRAPEIAAVPPNSPAYKAGLRPGDRIAALDGHDVHTQMQLRLYLGPRYAGQFVHVVALRGDERIERDVTLVDKLAPFEHAFLGLLPERTSAASAPDSVRIRFVYPGSPADKGGIRAGDEIVTCGEKPVASRDDALRALNTLSPGDKLIVISRRDQQTHQVEVSLDRLPTSIPAEIPLPSSRDAPADRPAPQRDPTDLRIAEYKNSCTLYVPETLDDNPALGVLVWLGAPGDLDARKKLDLWRPLCDQYGLIFAAPAPADPAQWSSAEVDYVHKVLHKVMEEYPVDRLRIVLHGEREGGTMAYWVAMRARELVRAVAVVDAPLPGRGTLPENDPSLRLAVYAATAHQARSFQRIEESIQAFHTAKYPVTKVDLGEESRYLNDRELKDLARWMDTLDRI